MTSRSQSDIQSAIAERAGRYLLWLVLGLPFAWISFRYRNGGLFYGEVLHLSGEFAARFLILTMAVTPFRLLFPQARWPRWLLARRRYFGVAAFAYAALHTIVYLDHKQSLSLVIEEAGDFSMWTGWLALLVFLALAVTSNDYAVRLLRRAWKKLHRWVYAAAALTFLHWIFAAFDYLPGLVHMLILVSLEAVRIWKSRHRDARTS